MVNTSVNFEKSTLLDDSTKKAILKNLQLQPSLVRNASKTIIVKHMRNFTKRLFSMINFINQPLSMRKSTKTTIVH